MFDGLRSSLAVSCFFLISLIIRFSSNFEIVGIKLIGRLDETSIGFCSGLGIIIICEIFNDLASIRVAECR